MMLTEHRKSLRTKIIVFGQLFYVKFCACKIGEFVKYRVRSQKPFIFGMIIYKNKLKSNHQQMFCIQAHT